MKLNSSVAHIHKPVQLAAAEMPALRSLYQQVSERVNDLHAAVARLFEKRIDRAIRLVTSKDEFERLDGISLLGRSRSDRAVAYLLDSFKLEETWPAKRAIISALVELTPRITKGQDEVVSFFLNVLATYEKFILMAAKGLERLAPTLPHRSDEIAAAFLELLKNPDRRIYVLAASHLSEILAICGDVEFHQRVFSAIQERFFYTEWTGKINCKKGVEINQLICIFGGMKDFGSGDFLGELLLQSRCPLELMSLLDAIERRALDENLHIALARFLEQRRALNDLENSHLVDRALEILSGKYWCE